MNEKLPTLTDYEDIYECKPKWKLIGIEYPPFDEVVLVTDGQSYQLRILRLDKDDTKYWESLMWNNSYFSASHWIKLPELQNE